MTNFAFQHVRALSSRLIAVKQNGKWGYTDANGQIILPCSYEGISGNRADSNGTWDLTKYPADCTEGYVVLFDVSNYGLYEQSGQEVIPFGTFECLSEVQHGKLWSKWNGTWGILTL